MIPSKKGDTAFNNSFERGVSAFDSKTIKVANNEAPKNQQTFRGDRNNGMDRYLSYPIARSMQEKTGDTLSLIHI